MSKKKSKLEDVLEGYKPISMSKLRYPRLNLSDDFVNAFHREFDRLLDEGQNPKSLLNRLSKALHFHENEERRYHKLDEEKGDHREDETPEAHEKDPSADFPYKKNPTVPKKTKKKPTEHDALNRNREAMKKHFPTGKHPGDTRRFDPDAPGNK